MKFLKSQQAALVGFWLALVIISLLVRSYIPVDETRYVTVAWNMWLRGEYLVPWLNGFAYSHKPPLLFWLMNAGWAVFGVNDWWPRLVPSFFALAGVFLTQHLAYRLWPRETSTPMLAPVILLGSLLWMLFATATMFDMMIACFTLMGMLGVMAAWQGAPVKGWLLVGLAIGLGLLAKGPTILLQILPVAMLAPWWGRGCRTGWGAWYAGMFGAILIGAAIALLWAIPAGMRGGEAYRDAIFWGQTADRMVNSFAHKRPFWWYFPLLPVILFPWLAWLQVWRGFNRIRQAGLDMGMRFCLAWMLPVFLAFCLISGKQMHYLLPVFPAFSLLVARALSLNRIHLASVWRVTLFSALAVVLVVYVALIQRGGLAYDVRPLAVRLKALQDAGIPLAHAGEYAGQYQFLGRMKMEPQVIGKYQAREWLAKHPEGRVVIYTRKRKIAPGLQVIYQQRYLDEYAAIVALSVQPAPKPHVL